MIALCEEQTEIIITKSLFADNLMVAYDLSATVHGGDDFQCKMPGISVCSSNKCITLLLKTSKITHKSHGLLFF